MDIFDFTDDKGLFDGKYKLIRPLSTEGGTADVWLAEDKDTEDTEFSEDSDEIKEVEGSAVLVAIKIYRPKNMLDAEGVLTFKKEYKTVYDCRHVNLLKPTGFSILHGEIPYLVMPFCEKGSAEQLLGKLTDKNELWRFIYDTASGLAYLHSCIPPIIHQDIKPANILIDNSGKFCITDFGISVKTDNSDYYLDNESSGTIIYMPPERFEEDYSAIPASDIWALGATIYELVTGDVPFGEDGGEAQLRKHKVPEIKVDIPKEIKNIIYGCLNEKPEKRPTAEQLAEIARTKGKKTPMAYVFLSFVIILLFVFIISWITMKPTPISPYMALCCKADSILAIEKSDAIRGEPVDLEQTKGRLSEVVAIYENAKKEASTPSQIDTINYRIMEIQSLASIFEIYKGVCDSLKLASEDGAEIQVSLLQKKRNITSDKIKNKINKL